MVPQDILWDFFVSNEFDLEKTVEKVLSFKDGNAIVVVMDYTRDDNDGAVTEKNKLMNPDNDIRNMKDEKDNDSKLINTVSEELSTLEILFPNVACDILVTALETSGYDVGFPNYNIFNYS